MQSKEYELRATERFEDERAISEATDMINIIVADAKMPEKLRSFLDAIIGSAQEKLAADQGFDEFFELCDLEVAKRARPDNNATADSNKAWSRRHRKTFKEWQETGWHFLTIDGGGQVERERGKQKQNLDTRYIARIIVVADQALQDAKRSPLWQTDRFKAMRTAYRANHRNRLKEKPTVTVRAGVRRRKTDARSEVIHTRKTLYGFYKRGNQKIRELDIPPAEQDEQIK
jgi:hypothetical protein